MNIFFTFSAKELYSKYEPYFSPLAVVAGFTWDNLTLQRIDLLMENIVILSYLALALSCILAMNAYDAGKIKGKFFDKIITGIPFLLQIVFGGLFSAFLIFYIRSATIVASWPFLLMLLALLIGNEIFRTRYQRFVFHISIFFITLFSYSVFALPILVKRIGDDVFILSGLISLGLISFIIYLIYRIVPERVNRARYLLISSIRGIFLFFNAMYFLNIIPPIPLALKESGVYHQVERVNGNYIVSYEPSTWYRFWSDWSPVFHWVPGEPVYNFTAIFAPTDIETEIRHRWSYYDTNKEEWVVKDVLSYPMAGGRNEGYRGYSLKYKIQPGRWRVDVITETDQILGRNEFKVIKASYSPNLKKEVK